MTFLPTLTLSQRRELNARLAAQGVSRAAQVERAGAALAQVARRRLGGSVAGKLVVVLAGPGDKGAAGLAAARLLHEAGATIRPVLAAKPDALHPLAAQQLAEAEARGLRPWGLSLSEAEMSAQEPIAWTAADLLIDALLGAGLVDDPRGEAADLIRLANATRRPILSLDVPSGLSVDDGTIFSPCLDAAITLALALPARGLAEGWPVVGEVWLADIGLPAAEYERVGVAGDLFQGEAVIWLGRARDLQR